VILTRNLDDGITYAPRIDINKELFFSGLKLIKPVF